MATGDALGKSKIGINTSRNRACNVIPEIKHPTDTIAPVPKNNINAKLINEKFDGRFKKIKKGIINNNSDIMIKMNAEITFAI
jgi:hypothetical protein